MIMYTLCIGWGMAPIHENQLACLEKRVKSWSNWKNPSAGAGAGAGTSAVVYLKNFI